MESINWPGVLKWSGRRRLESRKWRVEIWREGRVGSGEWRKERGGGEWRRNVAQNAFSLVRMGITDETTSKQFCTPSDPSRNHAHQDQSTAPEYLAMIYNEYRD
eukprot:scaffold33819_cov62-Phaeocystis_antarctica.AAC.1